MEKLKRNFGVNNLMDNIHIEEIEKTHSFSSPEFNYIIEIVDKSENNGNGVKLMKIYTNGALDVLNSGNWEVSPIIEMPYTWQRCHVKIEMADADNQIIEVKDAPENVSKFAKKSFSPDVSYVFELINELKLIQNKEHFEVLQSIKESKRLIDIVKGIWVDKPIPFSTIQEKINDVNISIQKYQKLKPKLQPEQRDYLIAKLNYLIESCNQFNAELLK